MFSERWHIVTQSEVDATESSATELGDCLWAKPIISGIQANGGYSDLRARPLAFELRFAREILRAGITPKYEVLSGVGCSQIDFDLVEPNWKIEVVSIDETSNVAEMTSYEDVQSDTGNNFQIRSLVIQSDAADARNTGSWQLIKVQEKIYSKVLKNGRPHKFPIPTDDCIHALLIDARGFNGGSGPGVQDLAQIVYGGAYAPAQHQHFFKNSLVQGLFDEVNVSVGANLLKERVHCLIFVTEDFLTPLSFWKNAYAFWNPFLTVKDSVPRTLPWAIKHFARGARLPSE